ncbi:zinc ribbon domain-containing protein [Paenibacillus zeisoli]|uniref:Zinc ribbon domain-containing protein n=1 Tax=Paenibacillus zeisoli TaxID=2496267 RepID=A0A433XBW9_9BACL|nr:zinc ribbon domain-containing protein [Paenibacillus zeisoli]RUT31629.1 zinc ribbon domain-containing protein [Paenibacillus zeisoli]
MDFLQRIKKGAGKATERAQNAVEISKLNNQISNIEREMGIYFQRMGQVFYEGYRDSDMSKAEKEMMDLAKTCDLLHEEKDEVRLKIASLRNERLCACGKVVPEEAIFCPYCGRKLESYDRDTAARKAPEVESESEAEAREEAAPTYQEKKSIDLDPIILEPEYVSQQRDRLSPEEEERRLRELERERERQLELDRRIRTWKENVLSPDQEPEQEKQAHSAYPAEEKAYVDADAPLETTNCQICAAPIAKGSKWCPSCGSEQI